MRQKLIVLLLVICTSLSAQVLHPQSDIIGQVGIHIPAVDEFEVLEFENQNLLDQSSFDRVSAMSFPITDDESISIEIWEVDLLADDYFIQQASGGLTRPNQAKTFHGVSADGGKVRLTLNDHFTYGFIEYGSEVYWIEPAWYYQENSRLSNEIIIYKESDVKPEHEMTCGSGEHHRKQEKFEQQRHFGPSRVGQCYQIELAIASDYSMFTKYGSSITQVENHNIAVMNNVQGDYTGSFADDVEYNIVTQFISDCSTCDPWTTSNNASTFLNSFTSWGSGGGFQTPHDLGQIWTNRNFSGTTVGIAWVGAVCSNFRYHALQDHTTNANLLRVTASHEIGHNFNAEHAPSGGFIMSPSVNNTTSWHPTTVNTVNNYINFLVGQGGCLSACTGGGGQAPVPQFETVSQNICPGTSIRFYDKSQGNPTSWSWTFPGGVPFTSTDRHPLVTYNSPGTYAVTLEVGNVNGTNTQNLNGYITVTDVGGVSFPIFNDFEDGFGDWQVINPDGSLTWGIFVPAVNISGTNTARMPNFSYPGSGQRDAIESPEFILAGYQSATLNLEYAYAMAAGTSSDSLIVYISDNDGQTFNRIFARAGNGTGVHATSPPTATPFDPENEDDWCNQGSFGANCISIDLSNYLGERDLIVRVENYSNSGNQFYLNKVYVSADCFDLPAPQADFVAAPVSGCSPLIVDFQDISLNSPFSWQWTFENGSPNNSNEQNPTVLYTTPGIHAVSLTVQNETGTDVETRVSYIEVLDEPTASFDANVNGRTVQFTNMSLYGIGYVWNFGDGNTSQEENPVHTYTDDGSYTVTLQVVNACGQESVSLGIDIATPPTAGISVGNTNGCAPFQVQFNSSSSANTQAVEWFFEGGTPSTSNEVDPIVSYNNPGAFDVVLIAYNPAGSDTVIQENLVVVIDDPAADFAFSITDLKVDFQNNSVDADNYLWDFGDGNTSQNSDPTHTYSSIGVYDVELIALNACGNDTIVQTVALGGLPSSAFNSTTASGCGPFSVTFDAFNATNDDDVFWVFEGGSPLTSTAKTQTVSYVEAGSYSVTCIVSNALGSDTTTLINYVNVDDVPMADFDYQYDNFLTFDFQYTGEPYDGIMWDFGDGTTSNEDSPTHQYTNMFATNWTFICITSNQCGADTMMDEIVFTEALVDLTLPFTTLCTDQVETFNAGGVGVYNADWRFEGGTPGQSNQLNPTVSYASPGTYDVTFIASSNGVSDTAYFEDAVSVIESAISDFVMDSNMLLNMSLHADSFEWYVDGVFQSNEEDFEIDFFGTNDVMLIAYNQCSADTMTQTITFTSTFDQIDELYSIKLYPNPSDGHFFIEISDEYKFNKMTVHDMRGVEVLTALQNFDGNTLDLSHLPDGVYFVRFIGEIHVEMKKVTVTRR